MDSDFQSRTPVRPETIKKITIKSQPNDVIESPGDFVLSREEELLKKILVYDGISNDVIEGYNDVIQSKIPESIRSSKIQILTSALKEYYEEKKISYAEGKELLNDFKQIGKKYTPTFKRELFLRFLDVKMDSPKDSNGKKLYPYHFRTSHKSYMATIKVKLGLEVKELNGKSIIIPLDKIEGKDTYIPIGDIPILTGSVLDNIVIGNIKGKDKQKYGEDPEDPMAQYIITGNNYIIFLKDTSRLNRIFCFYDKNNFEKCDMTNFSYHNTKPVSLITDNVGRIFININNLKKQVNVITFARLTLGVTSEELIRRVRLFSKKKYWVNVRDFLNITIENDQRLDPVQHISQIQEDPIGNNVDKKLFNEIKFRQLFLESFYSHIDVRGYSESKVIDMKLNLLSIQIARISEFINGFRKADDRDGWVNKSILNSAVSIIQMFNGVWKKLISNVEEGINLRMSGRRIYEEEEILSSNNMIYYKDILREAISRFRSTKKSDSDLGKKFEKNFLNTTWGVGNKQENGRTEMIQQGENVLTKYSLSTKINSPISEKGTNNIKLRIPRADQLGYVGIVETPESQKCGLRRNKAITCWISVDRSDTIVEIDIKSSSTFKEITVGLSIDTGCMLNGVFLGWCVGSVVKKLIVKKRRNEILAKDVSAVYDPEDNFLYIHTDRSRLTRPLLIVDSKNNLIIDKKGLWGANFKTLLSEGCIEYVDSWELDFEDTYLSESVDHIYRHQRAVKHAKDNVDYLETEYLSKGGTLKIKKEQKYFAQQVQKLENKIEIIRADHEQFLSEIENIETRTRNDINRIELLKEELIVLEEEIIENPSMEVENDLKNIKDKLYNLSKSLTGSENVMETPEDVDNMTEDYININESEKQSIIRNLEYSKNKLLLYKDKLIKYNHYNEINEDEYIEKIENELNVLVFKALDDLYKREIDFDIIFEVVLKNAKNIINSIKEILNSKQDQVISKFKKEIVNHYYQKLSFNLGNFIDKSKQFNKKLKQINSKLTTKIKKNGKRDLIKIIANRGRIINIFEKIISTLEDKKEKYIFTETAILSGEDLDTIKVNLKTARNIYTRLSSVKYSYCEISPNAHLGVSASTLPAFNHNEGPRNSYGASMNKQSLSSTSASDLFNFSVSMKRLAYGQRPIFETMTNKIIGMNENPNGENVKLAILDMVYNREDSIIMSQKAIDQGLFTMVVSKSYSLDLKKEKEEGSNIRYRFGKPPYSKKEGRVFDNLDENGIAMVGSQISVGDAIIGKYVEKLDSNGKIIDTQDHSLFAQKGQDGTVDRAILTHDLTYNSVLSSSKGGNIASVRIRKVRIPIPGDKFATRSAQKSVISMILPEVDLPFTQFGDTPDIIMNPLAIPSRMTVNQLIETLASKHGVLRGTRVNATGYRDYKYDEFGETLAEYGYNRNAFETFYDGQTGEKIQGQVFFGPCYYRALKHNIIDKIQFRSTGIIDPTTRQPPGGRETGGGLRLGEMEIDALIGHGADYVLQERTCKSSSEYFGIWCKSCGIIAGIITEKGKPIFKCGRCGLRGFEGFGKSRIPFTLKTFGDYMAGTGINMRLKFKE
uniref:DNA-directed RNA polymerase n=1 Tax=Pithovirus LCPAC001 TaxID=2506585 RepID=A0A481Z3G1_9VIRU|nr:MAG: DNA-directed RNA polymerase subunit beta [Pithovirus LCPAC001]